MPASGKGHEALVKGNFIVMKGSRGVRGTKCKGLGLGYRVSKEVAAGMLSMMGRLKAKATCVVCKDLAAEKLMKGNACE